ncbi:MAG: hypothetical protein D6706_18670 [Chloroflexi bacterium]|nr:MAG: hypothetical protein D6706_18670 [Chloroflexota bacterium]
MNIPISKQGVISPSTSEQASSANASDINSGILPVQFGGTGSDFSLAPESLLLYFSSTGTFGFLASGADGQVLGVNLGALGWVTPPSQLSDLSDVSSAPQLPNHVLATAVGGGAYEGRPLVADDIPDLPAEKITTGVLPTSRGGTGTDLSAAGAGAILYSDGVGGVSALPVGSEGQVLKTTGSAPTWSSPSGGAQYGVETLIGSAVQTTDGVYAAPITISLPDTTSYRAIRVVARTIPSSNAWLQMRINGDELTNYTQSYYVSTSTGHNLSAYSNVTEATCAWMVTSSDFPIIQFANILIYNHDYSMDNYLHIDAFGVSSNGLHSLSTARYNVASATVSSLNFLFSGAATFRRYQIYVFGIS